MLCLVEVGVMIIGVGISLLAGYLLSRNLSKPTGDDKPTTLAERGSYTPRVIGHRKVGAIVGWAGDRFSRRLKSSGGKGSLFPAGKETVWIENAWHILCIGPANSLRRILQNGTTIFEGPITRLSHPSGSSVTLDDLEGTFTIYWGENDQPINDFLGDPSEGDRPGLTRVGVKSRWPEICYVLWRAKRLGTSPLWPLIDYEIEVRTQETHLTQTLAYMPPTEIVGPASNPVFMVEDGASGVGRFVLEGSFAHVYDADVKIRLTDNSGVPDQDFTCLRVNVYTETLHEFTEIFVHEAISGSVAPDGFLTSYEAQPTDGINHAHIIAELLFSRWPFGAALDKAEWDMESLEALGVMLEAEGIKGSILAQEGAEIQSVLAGVLQDLGVMLTINPITGLHQFVPVREPTGILPLISADMQMSIPQIEVMHGERPVDRLSFEFSDRRYNYKTQPLGMGDDGQTTYLQTHRSRQVPIVSTVNPESAIVIANRRFQEEEGGSVTGQIESNRAARTMLPGQAFLVEGMPDIQRLASVQTDLLSSLVTLSSIQDFYGAKVSDFVIDTGHLGEPGAEVVPDITYVILEVPEYILVGQPQTVIVPRIRAHNGISSAGLLLSRDDTTYSFIDTDWSRMSGGELLSAISATHKFYLAEGPTFTTLGPDISDVMDLSADPVSWLGGRQLALINNELFFLQKVTALGGSTYRLDGLLRARYDTVRGSHVIGDTVFIFQNTDGVPLQDLLIEPQVVLWAKSQPRGRGSVPLSSIVPAMQSLYGKGVRPISIAGLRIGTGFDAYGNGADITINWTYFTPRTVGAGAGFQGAGAATSDADPEGDFFIEIMHDIADTVVRSFSQATAGYAYSAAQRSIDFAGEPLSFKVRITQIRGGLSSDPVSRTFTRL